MSVPSRSPKAIKAVKFNFNTSHKTENLIQRQL